MLALVLVERDPIQARQLLDEAAETAAPVGDRFTHLRIQMIRARVEIQLADSRTAPIATAAISRVFDEVARTGDVSSHWQLFAMAGYLLVHRPAADVATVVGIFEARGVENNRRQWLAGVAQARAELGDEAFEGLRLAPRWTTRRRSPSSAPRVSQPAVAVVVVSVVEVGGIGDMA